MRGSCDFCGKDKKDHKKTHKTKRKNVRHKAGAISSLRSSVTFYGECDKKARNSEAWEL